MGLDGLLCFGPWPGVETIDLRRENFNLGAKCTDDTVYSTMGFFGTLDIDLGQL
jgi:hypothetical protein